MAFREVRVFEVREVLRLWIAGESLRSIERLAGLDRKTIRRYVAAAEAAGMTRSGGPDQLGDEALGAVIEVVRPHRADGHGTAWRTLENHRTQIEVWVGADITGVKIAELLERRGVAVPTRTVQRYVAEICGRTRGQGPTVRIADGEPGDECQVDFGKMGLVPDPTSGRRRVTHALIFTACYSRHSFVWLTHHQTTAAVIEGCEAAWDFFGGVFRTLIPDNTSAIVEDADSLEPRMNQAFVEYAQARGFKVDPTRVRHPKDKPKVERNVPFVRRSFFAGEDFIDLPDAQRRVVEWCLGRAGLRIHGTTQARPLEVFTAEEQPRLLPVPTGAYDLPIYGQPKVARDHHIEIGRALYSVPGALIGKRVHASADRHLVRITHRGVLVKVHPRQPPGGRSTDAADLPEDKTGYALRDLDHLRSLAATHGQAIGAYAAALLDVDLPWTKMRSVYALLGLVKKWGAERVEAACAQALDCEAINVRLIGRMLERGSSEVIQPALPGLVVAARFARDPAEFAVVGLPGAVSSIVATPAGPSGANVEDGLGIELVGEAR